jgi:hypothetical protein
VTTRVEARTEIASVLKANLAGNFPGLPFFWDDTVAVDLDKVVRVNTAFLDTEEMTVDPGREMRRHGVVSIFVFQREGQPQGPALAVLDTIDTVVRFVPTTKVRFEAPVERRPETRDGWTSRGIDIPFYSDTLAWA